ncbi:cache and HAMP domain-containing protein [Motiliproteus sp. MSK22-1]|uniref:cache domain-containing protein n=1 Tax=Motiliproteus sp. MSK22-1 TaxID=1897630 RepID=UPI000978CA2A|nr:cache and HAMP domain-containing protein [Motiliproteus sp. MSK22-1]OMH33282.1 hypothetical protein BGP75_13640 [Motiliproteus sp. MSK22-1]
MADVKSTGNSEPSFSILYQILLTMCVIALIPLGGLWYISIEKSRQDWTDNVFQSLVRNTDALTRSVDDWTAMNLRVLEQNIKTSALLSMDENQHHPVLKTITDTYEWIYLAHTLSPDGQNVGRSDGKQGKYYGDRDYLKKILEGKELATQLLIGKTSGKPAFVLAKPIGGKEKGGVQGVLTIAMSLEDLSKTVTKTRIGETGFAILVDEQNRLMAHGKGEVASELQDFSFHPALSHQNKLDQDTFIFDDSGKKIVAYTKETQQGWTLIVQQDYQEAYSAADGARQSALLILAFTCVVVVIVAYLLARRLSTPIRNLTAIADEISRGKLGANIAETKRNDEIGALARAIERMGISLQMAFERLRKK